MGKKKIAIIGTENETKKTKKSFEKPVVKPEELAAVKTEEETERPVAETEKIKETPVDTDDKKEKKQKKIRVRGKRYLNSKKKVDVNIFYSPKEAIKLVKTTSLSKFTGNLEAHLVVKEVHDFGEVKLPHFEAKAKKIVIADDKIIAEIKEGKINFDVLLASPKIMPKLLPFAKLLGPKGLMPNPKNGTLTDNPEKAIAKFSENTIRVKTEKKAPLIHLVLGKLNQKDEELTANLEAFLRIFSPGQLLKAYLKATMGPSVKVKI